MFLGRATLGLKDFQYKSLPPSARQYNNITIYGGSVIVDKLKIENYEMLDSDLVNINITQLNVWNPDTTVLSAEFSNTLDAGNVVNLPSKVTKWQLYRQEVGSSTLQLLTTLQA